MEKPLETAWVVLKVGWGGVSGNHQGGVNSASQVDGVSDMGPACWFFKGRTPKGTVASGSTSASSCPDAFSFSPYVPDAF